MGKAIKWTFIVGGCLVVLVITALLLIPKFVNIEKYKPRIERQVSQATGRPFRLSDDLRLTLFPWASLSFSDLHLGNPPGFAEKDFITIDSFDVRVKLLPLLFKDVQVKRFILKGLHVVLETRKDGQVNWKFDTKDGGVPNNIPQKQAADKAFKGFDLKALAVGEFSVANGSVLWLDGVNKARREISDINLLLEDISLKQPVHVKFSARLDKMPITLDGRVGTFDSAMSQGTVNLDLSVKALDQIALSLKGKASEILTSPGFDVTTRVASFSPRKLLAAAGKPLAVSTADANVLNRLSLDAQITGNATNVTVSEGVLLIDDSKANFSITAKNFSKPDVTFALHLDRMDLDRYLPPPKEKKGNEKGQQDETVKTDDKKVKTPRQKPKKMDYSPLRKLLLDGTVRIDKLRIKKAAMEKIHLKIKAKNGIFDLDPMSMTAYQGNISANAELNVKKDTPKTSIVLSAREIQANPMLNDVLQKDFLEGLLTARMNLDLVGDDADVIKKTLTGKGDLLFKDGAIKGIDIDSMVRNIKTAFGQTENGRAQPRTDFSELHIPFSIERGVVDAPQATLTSPLLRVSAKGKADLVTEQLDFRVEPKFVGTLKGQGDTKSRAGLVVPILVTGTFAAPKFRPDLEAMFKQKIEQSLPDLQKQLLDSGSQKEGSKSVEKQLKDLIKGFGQ